MNQKKLETGQVLDRTFRADANVQQAIIDRRPGRSQNGARRLLQGHAHLLRPYDRRESDEARQPRQHPDYATGQEVAKVAVFVWEGRDEVVAARDCGVELLDGVTADLLPECHPPRHYPGL